METSDSDLRPAFTTTKLFSLRTTWAVMTSPGRISVRCRDSSKRAAKDSDIEFPCSQTGCTDATCAVCKKLAVTVCGRGRGWVEQPTPPVCKLHGGSGVDRFEPWFSGSCSATRPAPVPPRLRWTAASCRVAGHLVRASKAPRCGTCPGRRALPNQREDCQY